MINKENKPKCSKCESKFIYVRTKSMERVCRNCGYLEKIESPNQKKKKNKELEEI